MKHQYHETVAPSCHCSSIYHAVRLSKRRSCLVIYLFCFPRNDFISNWFLRTLLNNQSILDGRSDQFRRANPALFRPGQLAERRTKTRRFVHFLLISTKRAFFLSNSLQLSLFLSINVLFSFYYYRMQSIFVSEVMLLLFDDVVVFLQEKNGKLSFFSQDGKVRMLLQLILSLNIKM